MNPLFRALALIALLFICDACSNESLPGRTRLVLITLDTLRYDRFMATPERPSSMPRTWAHASRGRIFDRFYTVSGVTQPVHATFFTGIPPWEHGITRNGLLLTRSMPNVVEALRNSGFETHGVVASFPLTRRFGFDHGFDHFSEDFSHNLSAGKTHWEGDWKIEEGAFFAMADAITAQAEAALERAESNHQFFWFHYFDPHAPYGASSGGEVVRKKDILRAIPAGPGAVAAQLARAKARYDADVATLDAALDRLLTRLERESATIETHIVVVADHGESLGEGASVGHGAGMNEAELRVPAFILSPRVAPGRRDELAGALDIAPTLLALAGLRPGDDLARTAPRGRDLTGSAAAPPAVFAIRRTARDPGQSERRIDGSSMPIDDYRFAAIEADGTFHIGSGAGLLASEGAGDDAEVGEEDGAAWVERFDGFEKALGGADGGEELSPEDRRALEALGYIE